MMLTNCCFSRSGSCEWPRARVPILRQYRRQDYAIDSNSTKQVVTTKIQDWGVMVEGHIDKDITHDDLGKTTQLHSSIIEASIVSLLWHLRSTFSWCSIDLNLEYNQGGHNRIECKFHCMRCKHSPQHKERTAAFARKEMEILWIIRMVAAITSAIISQAQCFLFWYLLALLFQTWNHEQGGVHTFVILMLLETALHISYTVKAAIDAAVSASISTPVGPTCKNKIVCSVRCYSPHVWEDYWRASNFKIQHMIKQSNQTKPSKKTSTGRISLIKSRRTANLEIFNVLHGT